MADRAGRRKSLDVVYDDIAARANAISSSRDWPCRRGCADCCRSLAAPPSATRLEWQRLWQGFRALEARVQDGIRARVAALAATARGPYVCPMLDDASGACLVYDHRPAACRAYGFYAARDGGRWCQRIEAIANQGGDDIIWGNHEAIDRDVRDLHELQADTAIELVTWFADHPGDEPA